MWDRNAIDGVDISCFQPEHPSAKPKAQLIDWVKAIAAGVKFAVARVSYIQDGVFKLDAEYPEHARIVRSYGVELSGYHYFGPTLDLANARDQAKRFIDAAGDAPTLAPACDLETSGRNGGLDAQPLADCTEAFLEECDARSSKKTMLYNGPYFVRDHLREESGRFASRLLWLPEYGPAQPEIPKPWLEASIWQAQGDDGRVPGFPGPVDRNVFADGVTLEHLRTGVPPTFVPDIATPRGLQQALRFLGYDIGDFVDGHTGPRTAFAVSAFQKHAGLTPDGVVGPQTREALETAIDAATL